METYKTLSERTAEKQGTCKYKEKEDQQVTKG